MADVTVIEGAENEPLEASSPEATAETLAEAMVEREEVHTEAAVEIAQIEADRDIEIAETHAEVEMARVEATERDEEWRTETRDLRDQISALGEAVNATVVLVEELVARSTPPALPETVITTDLPVETETLTPETLTEPSSETETEAPESVVVVKEAVVLSPRRHRMI